MEGQRWRYMRRRISYKFSTKSLRAFFPTFVKCTEECITKCSEKARQGGDFDAQRVCGELALDIIKQFVFGVSVHSQSALESELMYYCRKVLNFSSTKGRLILDALFPTLLSSTENLIGRTIFDNDSNQFFIDFVKENLMRNCIDESCLLQFLKDEINSTAGEHELPTKRGLFEMNERSIAGICFNFLIAGYETSLNTMQFALFSLAHHKDIQDKAFQEISQVMGDKEKVLYDDVNKLTYLEQIFMETLRLFPPASRFDRKCRESITLSNVRFNRNCIASVPLFAIHYDEDVYPKANQFDPDRFSPEAVTSRNPYSFMPFGIGPRSCIGKRFAILQFKLTMACLLRNFVFEKCDNTPPEPLELDTRGMTRPKRPIILKITDRQFSPKKCSK
ncbi:hypothetical protein AB6A40_007897 [Gnathostoma spinigerum]|uniref:Cytochrome P450 n=1 Tax=Gnathostoma spinigerum TaxID=75299 RepID=A0ABD6EMK0_9BILA